MSSSLELLTTFDENFKVTSVLFFIPDFNLLSNYLINNLLLFNLIILRLKYYIESFSIKGKNKITILLQFLVKKAVSFASSIMKNIVACRSRFPVKLICFVAFESGSSGSCLGKSIAIIL